MTTRQLAIAAVSAALLLPPRTAERLPSTCLFRRVTGRPCPTCGMTRSWNAVAHGDLRGGLRWHPFGPATFGAAVLVAAVGPQALDRPAFRSTPSVLALGAAWIVVWLVRLARRSSVS